MNLPESSFHCTAGCPGCRAGQSGEHLPQPAGAPLQGWSLALAAGTYFILPLILALAGVFVFGSRLVDQFLGGAIGLGAGMAVAALLARLTHPGAKESA